MLQTEYPFTLPKGYLDEKGDLHREGVMRLSRGEDEILPLSDPRVEKQPAYLLLIMLSRVVIKLGGIKQITPNTMLGLFSEDLAYLQVLFNKLNAVGPRSVPATCPKCNHEFTVESEPLGESPATP